MIFYNFKLIMFSIILGTLTLIYNNDINALYKNKKYRIIMLVPIYFRLLAELSHEPTEKYKHESNKLREYRYTDEKKHKNIYTNDDTKGKLNIPEVTEKGNTTTTNLKKYESSTYYNEKEAKSNISSRSLRYLEIQKKLYNNFYVEPELDIHNFSDISNDKNYKCCEYANKKKSYNELTSLNKVHDNYLDNLKDTCVGGVGICSFSSAATGYSGVVSGASAAAAKAATITGLAGKLTSKSIGAKFFFTSSLETVIKSATPSLNSLGENSVMVATSGTTAFYPYGIAALILILIVVALIIIYVSLRIKRKNSWKHEYKKHLYT
ncbi:PIR protein, putative [Plasmodium sp. gorilla clade G1]|nr:PIR protein, putative [Plasmodium sp. gorilla clade G1]